MRHLNSARYAWKYLGVEEKEVRREKEENGERRLLRHVADSVGKTIRAPDASYMRIIENEKSLHQRRGGKRRRGRRRRVQEEKETVPVILVPGVSWLPSHCIPKMRKSIKKGVRGKQRLEKIQGGRREGGGES